MPCIGFAVCGWVQILECSQWLTRNFFAADLQNARVSGFYWEIFTTIRLSGTNYTVAVNRTNANTETQSEIIEI